MIPSGGVSRVHTLGTPVWRVTVAARGARKVAGGGRPRRAGGLVASHRARPARCLVLRLRRCPPVGRGCVTRRRPGVPGGWAAGGAVAVSPLRGHRRAAHCGGRGVRDQGRGQRRDDVAPPGEPVPAAPVAHRRPAGATPVPQGAADPGAVDRTGGHHRPGGGPRPRRPPRRTRSRGGHGCGGRSLPRLVGAPGRVGTRSRGPGPGPPGGRRRTAREIGGSLAPVSDPRRRRQPAPPRRGRATRDPGRGSPGRAGPGRRRRRRGRRRPGLAGRWRRPLGPGWNGAPSPSPGPHAGHTAGR